MVRVKRGKTSHQKRERVLRQTKGFRWSRKTKERAAKEALLHALPRKFRGRKEKKRTNRGLWQIKINAASRLNGLTYSQLINRLKKEKIEIDRKILAELAEKEPEIFAKIISSLK
jgi:large subunit ribosomal protein L20